MGDVTRVAKEALESHRMIKVFNAQPQQQSSFEEVNERNRASFMKLVAVKAVSNPVVQLIAAFGLAAVMYVAIRDVLEKGLSVGEFTSFLTALLLITAPLRRLVSVVGPLQQGIAAGQSVFEILDTAVPRTRAARVASSTRAGRSSSEASISPTTRKRAACCATSASGRRPARRSRSSAAPAAASRRWSACCPGFTTPTRGRCCWMASDCASTGCRTCATSCPS